jgi:hypothetical protein
MAFLPDDFDVPRLLETDRVRVRPLTIHDVVKDLDALMTSREHLWALFGEAWGWPPEDLTLEQDLVDLGWHQKEFERCSSFDYAVVSLDERAVRGCVYVDPPTKAGVEAEVYLWAHASELDSGLEDELLVVVSEWIDREWPFATVTFPGREIDWQTWRLPDRAG